jgi:hypothetical protein
VGFNPPLGSEKNMGGMTQARNGFCIKYAQVDGATANTNMAITGITTEDEIISVIALADTSNNPTDDTDNVTITSDGYIQSATNNSTATLLVHWLDVNP